jgi:ribosomal protein S18 acetylase RimI-like enzyme
MHNQKKDPPQAPATDALRIEELRGGPGREADGLRRLLVDVVEGGASIGFLPPLSEAEAERYWSGVGGEDVVLWVARQGGDVVGTVQLHLCAKPNGMHRAEIAKLMVSPNARRRGVARALMAAAEARARAEGRSLLVLDTREGDPSNALYASLGYVRAGRIPGFARSANGTLAATILYYKPLDLDVT